MTGVGGAVDDEALADAVLTGVGGAENVVSVAACYSRLRLTLHDPALRDEDAIRRLPGVLMVLEQGGQFQVVLGPRAIPVRAAVASRLM